MERGNGGRRLLVWDAPNMDMCLSEVIGERASAATRPNLGAVLAWLAERSEPGTTVEGCVFCNVPPGLEAQMSAWVVSMRHAGLSVFVKPKRDRRDDIDAAMLSHIERRFAQGTLLELVVASHDAKAFAGPLRRLARTGLLVKVLGYREKDAFASADQAVAFVDIEDVPGAFERPLPRTNLFDLPPSGRWFAPFVPLPGAAADTPTHAADSRSGGGRGTESRGTDKSRGTERGRSSGKPSGNASGKGGGSERDSGGHDATPLADPPSRNEVLAEVEVEVRRAVDVGAAGLTLRDVGELLRRRHPHHPLFELGFTSVAELVEALVEPGELALLRRPGEGHLLTIPQPAGAQPSEALPERQPADASAGDDSSSDVASTIDADGDAEGNDDGDDDGGPADDDLPADDAAEDDPAADDDAADDPGDIDREVTAEPDELHPIYRAFGLGHGR